MYISEIFTNMGIPCTIATPSKTIGGIPLADSGLKYFRQFQNKTLNSWMDFSLGSLDLLVASLSEEIRGRGKLEVLLVASNLNHLAYGTINTFLLKLNSALYGNLHRPQIITFLECASLFGALDHALFQSKVNENYRAIIMTVDPPTPEERRAVDYAVFSDVSAAFLVSARKFRQAQYRCLDVFVDSDWEYIRLPSEAGFFQYSTKLHQAAFQKFGLQETVPVLSSLFLAPLMTMVSTLGGYALAPEFFECLKEYSHCKNVDPLVQLKLVNAPGSFFLEALGNGHYGGSLVEKVSKS